MNAHRLLAALLLATAAPALSAATVQSFDQIQYWVGQGDNRAAVVIDWSEQSGQGDSTVWGYRWDGLATGQDMLLAMVASDQRLFARLDSVEPRLYGLGYDLNQQNDFALSDGTAFDEQGVARTSQALVDEFVTPNPGDLYGEGWYLKFWHYASRSGFDSGWSSNAAGMAARVLADGELDAWTYATVFNYDAYPDEPTAALPPMTPGDFNQDGRVDAADYAYWRNSLGDVESYQLWRSHYGQLIGAESLGATPAATQTTPEPAAAWLFVACLLTMARPAVRPRRYSPLIS